MYPNNWTCPLCGNKVTSSPHCVYCLYKPSPGEDDIYSKVNNKQNKKVIVNLNPLMIVLGSVITIIAFASFSLWIAKGSAQPEDTGPVYSTVLREKFEPAITNFIITDMYDFNKIHMTVKNENIVSITIKKVRIRKEGIVSPMPLKTTVLEKNEEMDISGSTTKICDSSTECDLEISIYYQKFGSKTLHEISYNWFGITQ